MKIFYLSKPGTKPRLLDLQANTLPRRCKSRLLPQGSRSVLYIPRPCDIHPLQIDIRPQISWYRNHMKMNPREIFIHRAVIGWVIYSWRHCHRAKLFYLSQPGNEPRSLDLQANTLPRHCKSQLLPQGSRTVLYIPRPCDRYMQAIRAVRALNGLCKSSLLSSPLTNVLLIFVKSFYSVPKQPKTAWSSRNPELSTLETVYFGVRPISGVC